MNKCFLWTVAIAALCSSCETADEAFATAKEQTVTVQQTKNVEVNNYHTYHSILSSFVYDSQQTYDENLLRFEQYVNRCMAYGDEVVLYEQLDLKQVAFLATTTV